MKDSPMRTDQTTEIAPGTVRLNWPLFLTALFAPPILTLVCALAQALVGDSAAPYVAIYGSGLGGLVSGVLLGRFVGKSTAWRIIYGILFSAAFAVACFGLSFGGCALGDYKPASFH